MTETALLSDRFGHTGEPALDLNETQKRVVQQIEEKIQEGSYTFERRPCPVCTDEAFVRIAEQDRYGLYHPVAICRTCGLIQSMPQMDERSYATFYTEEYRLLYDGTTDWEAEQFESQMQRAQAIEDYLHLADHRNETILDIGAGPGGMPAFFQEQGHEVLGCDLDESAVEYGRLQEVPMERASLEDLDLTWDPDVVILSHIVEHFQQAGLEPVNIEHAPALERDDEFGHIRATCARGDEFTGFVSDYPDALEHLKDLEAARKA
jgi:SAM-dependent methyltransferase